MHNTKAIILILQDISQRLNWERSLDGHYQDTQQKESQ
jgi:hypothetical protein